MYTHEGRSKATLFVLSVSSLSLSIVSKSEPQFPWNIMQSLQSRNSAFISVVELLCFFTSAWQALLALMGRKYLKTCHLTTQIMCKSSFHKRQYWQCCNILAIARSSTNIFSCLWKQNDDNLFATEDFFINSKNCTRKTRSI